MRIKTLRLYLQKLKEIKKFFNCNKFYLKPGKYYVGFNYRFLCHKSDLNNCFFPNSKINKATSLLIKIVNFIGYYCCKYNGKTENYAAIYFANNTSTKKEIKLFNFDKNKVLILCTNRESKEKQLSFYEHNKDNLCIPKCIDGGNNAVITELVRKVDIDDSYSPIKAIIDTTIKLGVNFKLKKIHLDKTNIVSCEAIKKANFLEPFPFCNQHGDLSSDNLIYGKIDNKTDFWWIDWEHFGERIFFYDLFFYMMNQAISNNCIEFTNNYLSGIYDEQMYRMFASFDLKFDENRRKEYFIYFFILFENERLNNITSNKIIELYKKYVYNFENNLNG